MSNNRATQRAPHADLGFFRGFGTQRALCSGENGLERADAGHCAHLRAMRTGVMGPRTASADAQRQGRQAVLEIELQWETRRPVLATGAHQHNTICLIQGDVARVSEEHGDLSDPTALRRFLKTLEEWGEACVDADGVVACDLHPAYLSTVHAHRMGRSVIGVQHHAAHAASVAVDAGVKPPYVAIVCDGTGLGLDGAIWGGEILHSDGLTFTRSGHLRSFWLPGGDISARHPWRVAAAIIHEAAPARLDEWARSVVGSRVALSEYQLLRSQLSSRVNLVRTSSLGRLFDGMAFIAGVCAPIESPGRAPGLLERMAMQCPLSAAVPAYPMDLRLGESGLELDWHPLVHVLLDDITSGMPRSYIGARFHAAIALTFADAAAHITRSAACHTVVLAGGCFLNRLLKEWMTYQLRGCGIEVATPFRVSSGDAGVSLGQAVVAAQMIQDAGARVSAPAHPSGCPLLTC